ncbi:MAG: tripartite tricarboxylate transporter substrate-binding protein [Acidocella sp.]|nr:tripartite tricarboxylate transporter substrate-binding protein [Acidocella sp.]
MSEKFQLKRREFLPFAASAMALSGFMSAKPAWASAYPNKPITFLIPDGIGGGASTYVREFSVLLGRYFSPNVNVAPINDQGANGQKAALDLFHATPDGYTIGMLGDVTSVKQGADLLDKLSWIANLGRSSFGLAVNAKSNIQNVDDLKKLSQTRQVVFSSSGKSALSYFAIKLFCKLNDINAKVVVGYKGSTDAMLAVTRGEADATAQSMPTLKPMQDSGYLRTVFVYATKSPLPGVEDATSIGQPDLAEIIQWRVVAAPPGTPPEIVKTLKDAFQNIAGDPATIAWSEKVHVPIFFLGSDATKRAVEGQVDLVRKWQDVLT